MFRKGRRENVFKKVVAYLMKSFTVHFGLRGWQEHLHMKMEDFIFKALKGSKDALPPRV